MKRKAFIMSVNTGMEEEYEQRHSPIWPELEAVLKGHGVLNYSIFLDRETRQLFGYAEIEDEERWSAIAETPICKRWWAYMREIMPSNPDNSPISRELKEVFHIDTLQEQKKSN
jgi:L-rhamnose mutarotase